jgi:hypothetical protein
MLSGLWSSSGGGLRSYRGGLTRSFSFWSFCLWSLGFRGHSGFFRVLWFNWGLLSGLWSSSSLTRSFGLWGLGLRSHSGFFRFFRVLWFSWGLLSGLWSNSSFLNIIIVVARGFGLRGQGGFFRNSYIRILWLDWDVFWSTSFFWVHRFSWDILWSTVAIVTGKSRLL